MAYLVLDLKEEVSFTYKCKTDAAKRLGVSVKTLYNWEKSGGLKKRGDYVIDCNCEIVGCVVRNREGKGLKL